MPEDFSVKYNVLLNALSVFCQDQHFRKGKAGYRHWPELRLQPKMQHEPFGCCFQHQCSLPKLFDEEKIDFQPIQCVNWAEYPYKPKVSFRIAHTQNSILLHFKVKEESVRAKYGEDNGSVWTDSCVEFFSIPAGDGIYYNIECNCIGTILIGAGPVRNNREHAPKEVTALVQRWSSLGNQPFAERVEETDWEVALIIPYAVFFKHQIESLDGK